MRTMLVVLLVSAVLHAQVTLDVPGTFPTIQAAINAAGAGDVVLVAPGTYFEADVDLSGKAITVRSSGGPSVTTLNCGSAGNGFVFQGGETSSTVVEGFTMRTTPLLVGGTAFLVDGASP